jgi:hypothetical protein
MDYMTSDQNSSVYVQMDPGGDALVPARIRAIFRHRRRLLASHGGKVAEEVFMVINVYLPLDEGKEDLFISFPDFGAACFSRHVDKSIRVIRSSQVKCHAICRPWGESTVVLRPLNRVCPIAVLLNLLLTADSRTVIAQQHIPQRRGLALFKWTMYSVQFPVVYDIYKNMRSVGGNQRVSTTPFSGFSVMEGHQTYHEPHEGTHPSS